MATEKRPLISELRFLADFNERNDADAEMTKEEWRRLCSTMTVAANVMERAIDYVAHMYDCSFPVETCSCGLSRLIHRMDPRRNV